MTPANYITTMYFDSFIGVFWLNKAKVNYKVRETTNSLFSAWLSQKHKLRNYISYGDGNISKCSASKTPHIGKHTAAISTPDACRSSYNNVGVSKEHEPQPVCDLRDAIASTLQAENPNDQPSVLNAWITIAEYATLDGSRFLITRSGGSVGSDHITTQWQRRGMLHEVLDTGLVDDAYDIVFDMDADDESEEDA